MHSPPMCYFLGLDLGMAGDFTALAVVERPEVGPRDPPSLRRPAYSLRHLHRFPLGTPYGEVIEALRRLLSTDPLPGTVVVVDQTGVGKSVVDMVRGRPSRPGHLPLLAGHTQRWPRGHDQRKRALLHPQEGA